MSYNFRVSPLRLLTYLSWMPVLYFPLALIGLTTFFVGSAGQSDATIQVGLQMMVPAIGVLLWLAVILAFSGILNLIRFAARFFR